MEILITIAPYILPVLASVITILLVAGSKKLMDKWGIERSDRLDTMIDKYVNIGVDTAEVSARKYLEIQGAKMDGESKKTKAIKVVMDELKQSGVTNVAEELVSSRIESWLEVKGHVPGTPSDLKVSESA